MTTVKDKVVSTFNSEAKKTCIRLGNTAELNKVIFREAGSLLKSYFNYCARFKECDDSCINLLASFVDVLPFYRNRPDIRHLAIQFNIYFAKMVALNGKDESFLRIVLVLWLSFVDSLPVKTRAHVFFKANPGKIVEMCFHQLQKSGDFFTQLKVLELMQSLTDSNDDKGANYLNKVNFRFSFDEVVNLRKLYLQFGEGSFFENSRTFLNHLNIVCKRDSNTFSIKVKLLEINGTIFSHAVDTWVDFNQLSLTISFFTTMRSLSEEDVSETDGNKFIFVEDFEQVESCNTKNNIELVIVPKKYRVTNANFDNETTFKDLYHFKFRLIDTLERITKLIDDVIPRFTQRKRKINEYCHLDAVSLFSFSTVTNSVLTPAFVPRKPLMDLNNSLPSVLEVDEPDQMSELKLKSIFNPTTSQNAKSIAVDPLPTPEMARNDTSNVSETQLEAMDISLGEVSLSIEKSSVLTNDKEPDQNQQKVLEPIANPTNDQLARPIEVDTIQIDAMKASCGEFFSNIQKRTLDQSCLTDKKIIKKETAQAQKRKKQDLQKNFDRLKERSDKEKKANLKKLQKLRIEEEKQEKEAEKLQIKNNKKHQKITKMLQPRKEKAEKLQRLKETEELQNAKNADKVIHKVLPMKNNGTHSDLNQSTNAGFGIPRTRVSTRQRKKPVIFVFTDSEDSEPVTQYTMDASAQNNNFGENAEQQSSVINSSPSSAQTKPVVKRQRRMGVDMRPDEPVVKKENSKKNVKPGRPKKTITAGAISAQLEKLYKNVPPPVEPRKPKISYASIFGKLASKNLTEITKNVQVLDEENDDDHFEAISPTILAQKAVTAPVEAPVEAPIAFSEKVSKTMERKVSNKTSTVSAAVPMKAKRQIDLNANEILPQAKRQRNDSMSASSRHSKLSFNMSMMENPLLRSFIRDVSIHSGNIDCTPEPPRALPFVAEINSVVRDFESLPSVVESPPQVVFQQPTPKMKQLEVKPRASTSDEELMNTTVTQKDLREDFERQFQTIMDEAVREIQQAISVSDLDFSSVVEKMAQLKSYASEKKDTIAEFLNLIKKANAMKLKIIALDEKEQELSTVLSSSINKELTDVQRHLDKKLSHIQAVSARSMTLVQKAKRSAWRSHVDRIMNQVNKSTLEMYNI